MSKIVKRLFSYGFIILILGLTLNYNKEIATFILKSLKKAYIVVELNDKNTYTKDTSYNFVKKINKLDIKSKQDLLNAYYSIIDSGDNEFTFYCSKEYTNCLTDIKQIIENQTVLSNINSFVHPYNSFSRVQTKTTNVGKITLKIEKAYTQNDIDEINKKVDEIIEKKIKDNMNDKEKIKTIHDYIIKHAKYDSDRSDRNIVKYKSDIAYGPLLEGYGICGGYTDAMAIFLNRFNIPNFKVISENHIWNAVYVDDNWYHLDLTWDDPVDSNGADVLEYNIFLISSKELDEIIKSENKGEHKYDKTVFDEIK